MANTQIKPIQPSPWGCCCKVILVMSLRLRRPGLESGGLQGGEFHEFLSTHYSSFFLQSNLVAVE